MPLNKNIAITWYRFIPWVSNIAISLFNGTYNGIKGTLIGVTLGVLLVSQINKLVSLFGLPIMLGPDGQGLPVELAWQEVSVLVLFSLLLCFLASLYPAYRAVRVDPAAALKYE